MSTVTRRNVIRRTPSGDALTDLVMATFQLNGRLLAAAEAIARPVGLTAAWWQVLGPVLSQPATIANVARDMGLARQSVQRIADLLVERGFAEYLPNPSHKRAHLLQPTTLGRQAIADLAPTQHRWANQTSANIDVAELRQALRVMSKLLDTLSS
jgi:DNA-binding MarR family transcriptional regulator